MKDNNEMNRNMGNNETVSLNIPLSDLQYSLYRKDLFDANNKLDNDPDAYLSTCGIIIRSKQLDETEYRISNASFGTQDNLINTLAFTLIRMLKSNAGSEREAKKVLLNHFLSFFRTVAIEEFFGVIDADDISFDDL